MRGARQSFIVDHVFALISRDAITASPVLMMGQFFGTLHCSKHSPPKGTDSMHQTVSSSLCIRTWFYSIALQPSQAQPEGRAALKRKGPEVDAFIMHIALAQRRLCPLLQSQRGKAALPQSSSPIGPKISDLLRRARSMSLVLTSSPAGQLRASWEAARYCVQPRGIIWQCFCITRCKRQR